MDVFLIKGDRLKQAAKAYINFVSCMFKADWTSDFISIENYKNGHFTIIKRACDLRPENALEFLGQALWLTLLFCTVLPWRAAGISIKAAIALVILPFWIAGGILWSIPIGLNEK